MKIPNAINLNHFFKIITTTTKVFYYQGQLMIQICQNCFSMQEAGDFTRNYKHSHKNFVSY